MIKRSKLILAVVLTFAFSSCKEKVKQSTNTLVKTETTHEKTNIVFILADDLGYGDVGVFGQEKIATPNIDKLAKEGMMLTQHYAGNTVCAPSRSSLMTGEHTGHTYIRGNKENPNGEGQEPLADNVVTIAEKLKKEGYITGAFGKWGLGSPGTEGDPVNQGFDKFFGYNCQRMAHHYYPYHLWDNQTKVELEGNSGKNKTQYAPELIQKEALKFIKDNQNNPFFLFVPTTLPHAELAAPKKNMVKYESKGWEETPYKGYDDGEKYRQGPYESQQKPREAFAAMVDLLDEQVGEIVNLIDSLGLSKNTIIVFSSDNGPHKEGGADPEFFNSNGDLQGFKRDLYEGGIRVPTIVRWDGHIKANSTSDVISAFWDWFPTFEDLASNGSKPVTDNIDGVSLVPSLLGQPNNQKQHEYLYWEFHEKGGRQAIRMGNYKAIRYDVLKHPNSTLELYDVTQDIGEEHNLAKQYPELVKKMDSIMKVARTPSDIFTFKSETFLQE